MNPLNPRPAATDPPASSPPRPPRGLERGPSAPGRTRPALGSTSCVPDAGLLFLLLFLPLDLGLEVLDLPVQVGDDVRVLGEVVGHAQQVALDLRGRTWATVRPEGPPHEDMPDSDLATPETPRHPPWQFRLALVGLRKDSWA